MLEKDAAVMREAILLMRTATARMLADRPAIPFGRARRLYVWVVAPFTAFTVVVDLMLGRPMTALWSGIMLSCAIAYVVGSWLFVRTRRERDTMKGLWLAYAENFLKSTDRSLLQVDSLRILAEAENSLPPMDRELAEIERQLKRAAPLRAAGISAYLQLRLATSDRRIVARAARTMRNAS
jgi:hypothetical protein